MADEYETEGYNGLRDPLDSARDWHRILEYNINETDESLIKRAPLSERPDPGQGNDDRLFLATDIGVLYRDTGTSWEVSGGTDLDGADLTAKQGSVVVWDSTNEEVPQAQLGGPAASLSQYPLANSDLANSTVTVAGNSVGLGGSTGVAYVDLSDTAASFPIPIGDLATPYSLSSLTDTDLAGADLVDGTTTIWDATNAWVPESVLENNTVTVAGNAVSLGNSTAVAHADLSNIGSGDHHTRYADSEAQTAVEGSVNVEDLVTASATAGHVARSQGDGTLLMEALGHSDLSGIASDDHHTRYADSEARTAVEGSVNVEDLVTGSATAGHVARSQGDGTLLMEALAHGDLADAPADAHHAQNHGNADHSTPMVEDGIQNADSPYQIQKNGTDGAGIINFKT